MIQLQIMKAWTVAVPSASGNQQESGTHDHQKRWATETAPVPIQRAMFVWLWWPKGFAWLCDATAELFVAGANHNAA